MKLVAPLSLLIALVCCQHLWALGGDHPNGQPVGGSSEWSAVLKDLANSPGRVHGYFVNANDFLFFAGNMDALNKFLEHYGKLEHMPLKVTLHVGRKTANSPWGADRAMKPAPFQWQLTSMRRGWGAPEDPTALSKYVVTVDVWLDGLELEDIKIPKHVAVESGGEIEAFIALHRRIEDKPAAHSDDRLAN